MVKSSSPLKIPELDPRKMRMADAWYWAEFSDIRLGSGKFTTTKHEYEIGILQCDHPNQCAMKGAQMGLTEIGVLKTLWGHIYGRYPQGTLYLFPTWNDVTDFSKGRFNPLIYDNPEIARHVKGETIAKATEAATIKRIGGSMLYLRSARETGKIQGSKATSPSLKSVAVDRLVFDERDEMADDMVDLALERVSHSEVKEIFQLSTPSVPDYGIDAIYQKSDQRCWFIKCRACGQETCLELEFPECIKERNDGSVYRACMKCGKEIYPRDGDWIALYPERKDLVGWRISQLNSMYIDPGTILALYNDPPNGNIAEVYNSKLGMAYIEAENRLTKGDVFRCCGMEANGKPPRVATGMGVDVGKDLHVAIGHPEREGKSYRLDYVTRVKNFNDLHDLVYRYDVRCAVIDQGPETRKVREFQANEEIKVFLCTYLDKLKVAVREDQRHGMLAVNRTELCDRTHDIFTKEGMMEIPRRCSEIEQFASEMSNTAKQLEEDKRTGSKIYRYRKLGDDHYYHAVNYLFLACEDPSVKYPMPSAWELESMSAGKSDKERNDWDPLHR